MSKKKTLIFLYIDNASTKFYSSERNSFYIVIYEYFSPYLREIDNGEVQLLKNLHQKPTPNTLVNQYIQHNELREKS